MTIYNAYEQVAEMIAKIDASKLSQLKATPEIQDRFEFLVQKSKDTILDSKEKDELDHFIVLERLIRLAKIRAAHPSN